MAMNLSFALPKILEERLSGVYDSATAIGGSAFAVFAIASMAQILIGHLVDRHSIRTVFAFVAGLQIPAYMLAVGLSGLPVLVVTAFGDWGSYSRAIELNAAAYLTKPFRSEELQREVQRALSTTRDETVGRASSQS